MKKCSLFLHIVLCILCGTLATTSMAGMVPSDYVRLAYLDSTAGTCWIDTGYAPANGHRLDFEMMPLSAAVSGTFCRYFGYTGLVGIGRHQLGYWQLGKDMNNQSTAMANANVRYLVTVYMPEYSGDYTKGAYLVNDTVYQSDYAVAGSGTVSVFGRKTGADTCECSPSRVYSLRISSTSALVHEYLPVKRVSDDALGLYDTVSGEFYEKSGTGDLTAGPAYVGNSIKIGATSYDSLEAAYAAASDTETNVIEVTSGSEPVRLTSDRMTLAKPVIIRGTGATRDDTVIVPKKRSSDAYLFTLDNPGVRFENLTIAEGHNGAVNSDASGVSPIIVNSGVISNCVVRSFSGTGRTGAIRMEGGVVQDSLIRDNSFKPGANTSVGFGGGISLMSGSPLVTNCVITGCRCGHSGGGVYMAANSARLIGCVVTNNTYAPQYGAGLYISAGTVEDCVIAGNGDVGKNGSGVCVANAVWGTSGSPVFRRCLIADNKSLNLGAGVYMTRAATFVSCSIINNVSQSETPGGVHQTTGTFTNCLFALNQGTGTTPSAQTFSRTGGTIRNCVSDAEIPAGGTLVSNLVGAVNFVNPYTKDYHLAPGCVGYAGCYPYAPGKLACAAVYDLEMHDGKTPIAFTSAVDGSDKEGLTYAWDFDGDGTVDSTAANPSWANAPYGTYRVKLTVRNTAGDTAVSYVQKELKVLPSTVYVNTTGTGTYPYDTSAKATNDVQVALDAVCATDAKPGKVVVAEGTYDVSDFWIQVTKPVEIVGEGPSKSILRAYNGGKDYRRVMLLNHTKAVVSGIGMTNGRQYNGGEGGYTTDGSGPGGLRLVNGVVTNCWIYDCKGSDNAGGVDQQGGLLVDSHVFRCWAGRYSNGNIGRGGGIHLSGGLVENCVISNNQANGGTAEAAAGAGAFVHAGTMRNCRILNNKGAGYGDAKAYRKCAGLALGAGLVERCEIAGNNTCTYGAGVYMAKLKNGTSNKEYDNQGTGILRNCFIHDNTCQREGAGVYLQYGTVEHCTIVGNTSKDLVGGGLYQAGGTLRNCIIYENGDPAQDAKCNVNYSSGTFDYNISKPAVSGSGVGAHNLTDAPGFTDAAHGDYTLATGSVAIDSACEIAAVTNDYAGAARPKRGAESSASAISDRGAWEAMGIDEGDFRCSISYTQPVSGLDEVTVTYTANPGGNGMSGEIDYYWDYAGGSKLSESASGDSISVKYTNYGYHSIGLVATNALGKGSAPVKLDKLVAVGAKKVYISTTGQHIWPYETWEHAATNVMDVFNSLVLADGQTTEIVVNDGTYPIEELWVKISSPIYFHSVNGPERTILTAANGQSDYKRILMMSHKDAVCEGFTMTGGSCYNNTGDGAGPGALRLIAGTVRNCFICDNQGADNSGGVDMQGGTLDGCQVFRNLACRYNNNDVGVGAGIHVSANNAKILNCVISNNTARVTGGGIQIDTDLTGVVVSNCVIAGNVNGLWSSNASNYSGRNGSAVYALSGLLTHNVITGNYCQAYRSSGGTKMTGEATVYIGGRAELWNSLVARNLSAWGAQGVLMDSANAKVVNCTITENGQDGYAYKEADNAWSSKFTAGALANTIIWGDRGEVTLSLAAGVTQSHNWTEGNPQFKRPAKDDWRLKNHSPCVNAGDNAAYGQGLETATDLDGQPRIRNTSIDIGCYEHRWSGLSFIVR